MILLILRTYFNLFRLTKLYIYVGVSTSGITMVFRMGHPGWVEDVEARPGQRGTSFNTREGRRPGLCDSSLPGTQ